MSGHSHWATIRRKKDAADAKKGKVFSKLARAIMAAARTGGGDLATNIRLKALVEEARGSRMPKENIERAIKKGTGDLAGDALVEVVYEGYAPGGVALVIECLTDNRNRTAAEVRRMLDVSGGTLAGSGATSFQFEKKGLISVSKNDADEEKLFEIAVDAGAEEIEAVGEEFQITCPVADFEAVKQALADAGIAPEAAQLTMVPNSAVPLDEASARKVLRLMNALDDCDDVQNVYANFDLPEEVLSEQTD